MKKKEMFDLFRSQTECGFNHETIPCEQCDAEAERMVEIGEKIYNQALEDVKKHGEVKRIVIGRIEMEDGGSFNEFGWCINEESIDKLKK